MSDLKKMATSDYRFAPNSKLALWLADRVFAKYGVRITAQERVAVVGAYLGTVGSIMAERDYDDVNVSIPE